MVVLIGYLPLTGLTVGVGVALACQWHSSPWAVLTFHKRGRKVAEKEEEPRSN